MSDQWSDNLRERMEAHPEPSPEGLWEDIERLIKKEIHVKTVVEQNKIILWGKRIGAVAAVVLAMLLIGDYLLKRTPIETRVPIEKTQTPYKPENRISALQDNHEIKPVVENSYHKNNVASLSSGRKELSGKINERGLIAGTELKEETEQKEEANGTTELKKEQKEELKEEPERNGSVNDTGTGETGGKPPVPTSKNSGYGNEADPYTHLPITKRRDKPAKWETGVYASNMASGSTKKYDQYANFVFEADPLEEDEGNLVLYEVPDLGEDPVFDILLNNKYKEIYTDIKHRQPVAMGVSVSYNLDGKWSITSGLTYTILSSQLRSGSDNYYFNSEQTLYNIGIPLNINYNVWRNKKISIYLSGGGHVEKTVSGTFTTDYIVDNQLESSKKDKISEDRLQWSINTAAGVQYNLSPKIGLYAEPGAAYYFKNGSKIETIYKEKPINISLRLGLRFSLGE